jgi:hypothetical protein
MEKLPVNQGLVPGELMSFEILPLGVDFGAMMVSLLPVVLKMGLRFVKVNERLNGF